MKRYDIAIIGSGPAGLEAAINAKIRNKKIILFGSASLSQKITAAPRIGNYLGFPEITGKQLQQRFLEHLERMEISIQEERINAVYSMGSYFALAGHRNNYEAEAVIVATGIENAKPFEGEERLLGKGVGYCATCDAPLYRGKTVCVIGYNEEAEQDANFVAELAGQIYYIPMKPVHNKLDHRITVLEDRPMAILGDDRVTHLHMKSHSIPTDAVFILRDSVSPSYLVPGIEMEDGFIKVDMHMQTSLPGLFAAGDCTGKPHQYMRAAGQGQTAALNAAAYLDRRRAGLV